MMLIVGIILCYLLGLSVLITISRKYSFAELLGFSFLAGIGFETFFLFILDIIHVRYSQGVLIGINVVFIAALCGINYKNLLQLKNHL